MENQRDASELEVAVGDKKLRLTTKYIAELISLLLIAVTGVSTTLLYQHTMKSDDGLKEMAATLKDVVKDLAATNRNMTEAQREMNCLIALPPDKREADYQTGFCKRLAAR